VIFHFSLSISFFLSVYLYHCCTFIAPFLPPAPHSFSDGVHFSVGKTPIWLQTLKAAQDTHTRRCVSLHDCVCA